MTSPLLIDLYQLTMAQAFWEQNIHDREAIFYYSYRTPPHRSAYTIVCGLQTLLDSLDNFHFSESHIHYLRSLQNTDHSPLFSPPFLSFLQTFSLQIKLTGLREGSLAFPNEPILKVQGPLMSCQLIETLLLNTLNYASLIATKASRLKLAARQKPLLEFGARRAQGANGALTASYASYIGGVDATSNLEAGYVYGIPVRGTQAHSFVLAHATEQEAFRAWAKTYPNQPTVVVDTYHTLEGVKHAIETIPNLHAVRLDSGNLLQLSRQVRHLLDAHGLYETKIYASNNLNETFIDSLTHHKSPIDCFGIGTQLVTGGEHSALDGVYKLCAIQSTEGEWIRKMKTSDDYTKQTLPGSPQILRHYHHGTPVFDLIFDELTPRSSSFIAVQGPTSPPPYTSTQLLLQPLEPTSPIEAKQRAAQQLSSLDSCHKHLHTPSPYPIYLDPALKEIS